MTEPLLRPRSASELLDAAFRILRLHFPTYLVVSAVGYAPTLLLAVGQLATAETSAEGAAAVAGGPFAFGTGPGLAITLAYVGWWAVLEGVYASMTSSAYLTGEVSFPAAFARAVRRAPALVGAMLLVGLSMAAGLVLLVIPGLYVLVRLFTTMEATVLEGDEAGAPVGPLEAAKRTWGRTKGRFGHVLATMLLAFLCFLVLYVGAMLLGTVLAAGNPASATFVLVVGAVSILVYPLIPIVSTVLYYDLRIRSEGYDLEAQFASLGAGPPAPGAVGGELPPAAGRLRIR